MEPLRGWRHSSVRETRTAFDWAEEIKYLLTECYPEHRKIILVMDNLNIAEIELDVMTRQCLDRRIDSILKVRQELSAWENMRNQESGKVIWQFTTPQARTKLISLYSQFESSGE